MSNTVEIEKDKVQDSKAITESTGLKGWGRSVVKWVVEVFQSIRSKDAPTRVMAFLFSVSFVGLLLVFILAFRFFWFKTANQKSAITSVELNSELKGSVEGSRYKNSIAELGSFQIELKVNSQEVLNPPLLNIATVNVVLLCGDPETAKYFKENLNQVRSIVVNIFLAIDREELLSMSGKKRLKLMIQNKLEAWLPKGNTIKEVFFSKLILN